MYRRVYRRAAVLLAAAGLLAGLLPAAAGAQTVPAVERRAGADRYATAAAVSAATFAPGVPVAYVATGQHFADALAGGAAAGAAGGPVLLVTRTSLPDATRAELGRLQPARVAVLGGTAAVDEAVLAELRAATGVPVDRIAGADRYATAAAVSAATFGPGVPVAYVATGQEFADALAAGPAAVAGGGPVLLVTRTRVPPATAGELQRLQPGRIAVLGGTAAVTDDVARALAVFTAGPVDRLAGPDRFATAAAVATAAFAPGRPTVYLATGATFADALAGTPAAAREGAPILLVHRTCVPDVVRAELARLAPERIVILGGTAAVAERVETLGPCGREVEVIATGLTAPWDVAFTPDGRAYLTERDTGRIHVREPDGSIRLVQTIPGVNNEGEGGLLGLTASPGFAQDGLLYAYVTTATDNRVVRFRPGEPPAPVLTGIPRGSNHNGGRIAFGPDGMLYVATGDAGVQSHSQDPASLAGKILRVTPDGAVPPGNPFGASPVWAVGIRNAQGLAWDAQGRLYATEFGPNRDDEVNIITAGSNYGWPVVTGAAGDPRFVDPIVVRQPTVASWSGAAVLTGGSIPAWEGSLFVAALRGQRLWRFSLAEGVVTAAEELLVGEYGRLRAVAQAPDGALWVLTNNRDGRGSPVADDDRIIRIGPPR
jgi:glucose/arabinose dehydrogenase/putative cell wall-binding protein